MIRDVNLLNSGKANRLVSTALLKFRPKDGSPYRFPNTWRTIPFGAMMPSGVAMQRRKSLLPGVTKYASTRSPPRNVKPYSADNAKKILMDVAATLPQYVSSGS